MLAALTIGISFGFFLERAGLGNARKLSAMFYLEDFTVLKVMFSAILTAMLGVFWLARLGVMDISTLQIPDTLPLAQTIGAVLFGAGFALGGLCPGTSCVSAASGRIDGAVVAVGIFAGVLGFGLLDPVLGPVARAHNLGPLTLPQLFGIQYGAVVLLVVALALVSFAVIEKWQLNRAGALSAVALVLGALALLAGPPRDRGTSEAGSAAQAVKAKATRGTWGNGCAGP